MSFLPISLLSPQVLNSPTKQVSLFLYLIYLKSICTHTPFTHNSCIEPSFFLLYQTGNCHLMKAVWAGMHCDSSNIFSFKRLAAYMQQSHLSRTFQAECLLFYLTFLQQFKTIYNSSIHTY